MTAADRFQQRLLDVEQLGVSRGRLRVAEAESDRKQPSAKPIPATALKLQQEELDSIGLLSSINADLAAVQTQVQTKTLDLGLIKNLESRGRNIVGMSNENSRNYASFRATLEKLRNDSLRLNKGVQTEGDSVRAWNELFDNINDPKVVNQRLGEIQKTNERAANLRKMNVDIIRQNYGHDPLDTTPQAKQSPAVGASAKTVVRRGKDASGRAVVQYSDGSIQHAD